MQKIAALIPKNIKNHKIDEKVRKYEVLGLWEKKLLQFFPNAHKQTMIMAFDRGTLRIAVLSKDLADQINAFQHRIIYELNTELGNSVVSRISCEC